jgi:hypothetical protein
MPIFSVQIVVVEELDKELMGMCKKETAILIQDGSIFSNIFPKSMDRSRVFRKKYGIALRPGSLLFTRLAEISLFFDYRYKRGEVQINQDNIALIDKICPEIKDIMERRDSISYGKNLLVCLDK